MAYEATGAGDDADTALVYFNALLDDYQTVGDGAGGDDVVRHDDGYAMRSFAPFAALAYDWLYDAPGTTDALRQHARERLGAWFTWYASDGYLNDVAAANYHAGYTFAATLIGIAIGDESDAGAAAWDAATTKLFDDELASAFAPGGALDGGDWPEGWQYGPLSALEYALAARALAEQGASIAGADAFADALVDRQIAALTPDWTQTYVGGDTDAKTAYVPPHPRTLLATRVGPASPAARSRARGVMDALGLAEGDFLVFQALAEARGDDGAAFPGAAPTVYVAPGTRTIYARSDWTPAATWSVFQCAPHLVPDHQHRDAGNWLLSRGADALIVDPSPYGSLSTLTGNAPAIDSDAVPSGYSPSQGTWAEETGLVWARETESGLALGRCDYADQFRGSDEPSDVGAATRDWIFLPQAGAATIALVDRARTGDPARGLHVRARSSGSFDVSSDVARADVGSSRVFVRTVADASPEVHALSVGTCDGAQGSCTASRLDGSEVRIDVAGPGGDAIHIVDAAAVSAAAPSAAALEASNATGAWLARAPLPFAVVVAAEGATSSSYVAPDVPNGVHVVLDAPAGDGGRADVSATPQAGGCRVTVTARAGASGGLDARPLVLHASSGCALREESSKSLVDPSRLLRRVDAAPPDAGGCSCRVAGAPADGDRRAHAGGSILLALAALVARRLRRLRRRARRPC